MAPPKLIKISDVPKWVVLNYGIEKPPTRQTVYNWITKGRNGIILKSVSRLGRLYVAERHLHEFAEHL